MTRRTLGPIILLTIFGLLAVLILEFKTFRSTIIVLSVIPLGIIGAILMLLITGYPFSFTGVVGLIGAGWTMRFRKPARSVLYRSC